MPVLRCVRFTTTSWPRARPTGLIISDLTRSRLISPRRMKMATLGLIEYQDASPEVRAVYDDIMATRKTDWINNFRSDPFPLDISPENENGNSRPYRIPRCQS